MAQSGSSLRSEIGEAPSLAAQARAYGEVMMMVALATVIGWFLARRWGTASVDLLYLPPVLAAASLFGLRPALFAAVVSALAYNFFFTVPVHTFRIDRPTDVVTVAILFLVAIVTSQLAARMREQARLATANASRNATIAGLARRLISCTSEREIAGIACLQIASLFDCNVVLLVPRNDMLEVLVREPADAPLTPSDMAAAALTFATGEPAGRGAPRLDPAEWQFHAVRSQSAVLGAMGLARDDGTPPVPEPALPLLTNLLDQVALALERASLEAEMQGVAQLRERDRLRGVLLSSVGHDLRTPLTAIIAASAELRRTAGGDSSLTETIASEAGKLERYIANLLDLARLESGRISLHEEPIDLVDSVAAAIRDLGSGLAHHTVQVELAADLPLVKADPRLLHHCLLNVIDNAARYSPRGSEIIVEGRQGREGVDLTVLDEGNGLSDNGPDMFDTFARLDGADRKGSSGLGLAIAKGFALAMDLELSGTNRKDHCGAAFTFHFPGRLLVDETADTADEQGLEDFLVVEDDPEIRTLLRRTLSRADYKVIEAGSAREARHAKAIDRPDLVLLDLGLPDHDGLDLIADLRSDSPLRIIVVSAREDTEQKVAALDLGADDYVTKPFDTDELLARVRASLRQRLESEADHHVVLTGTIEIDLLNRIVREGDRELHLTPKEYAVLEELAKRPGRVLTHTHLLRTIWGPAHQQQTEYLRVVVRGLRQKIEREPSKPQLLINEPGIGYRLLATRD